MPDYTYHPDLARYAHMKSTLSPWFVRLSHGPMKLLYAAQQSGGGVRVSRLSVPRSDGSCLRMLLYAPAGCEGETPCVYFLHGGGFVFNSVHNIQGGIPTENLLALVEALQAHR